MNVCSNGATTTTGEPSTAVPVLVMVSSYLTMSRPEGKDTIYQREGGKGGGRGGGGSEKQTSIDFRFFPRGKDHKGVGTASLEIPRNTGSCDEVWERM